MKQFLSSPGLFLLTSLVVAACSSAADPIHGAQISASPTSQPDPSKSKESPPEGATNSHFGCPGCDNPAGAGLCVLPPSRSNWDAVGSATYKTVTYIWQFWGKYAYLGLKRYQKASPGIKIFFFFQSICDICQVDRDAWRLVGALMTMLKCNLVLRERLTAIINFFLGCKLRGIFW